MRKKLLCLCTLIILSLFGIFVLLYGETKNELCISMQNNIIITIDTNGSKRDIYPYLNPIDGLTYFFLPAYVDDNTIYIKSPLGKTVTLNGEPLKNRYKLEWQNNEIYNLSITDSISSPGSEYQIVFMKSANLPTIFIETQSGSMEYLHENKENREPGQICIMEENGELSYSGNLESISGRGNSTWGYDKKPYHIKLKKEKALLGMDQGKNWYLLPVYIEKNRMNTKVALNIASKLGLSFTSECTWIDLYLNGEYSGNYLLCESITVDEGRIAIHNLEKENKAKNPNIDESGVFTTDLYKGCELAHGDNINGGYLIEKDVPANYDNEISGFQTASGAYFVLKSPEHASREQVEYIMDYFQTIENMIASNTPDYANYIDLDSFAARFLIEEISLNWDADTTSMFFYKNKDSNLLYAGPVWDFDSSMGWGKEDYHNWSNYEYSIIDAYKDRKGVNSLNWHTMLYENEEFYNKVTADFQELLPYMETLLETTIDEYADTVRVSTLMDEIRWQYTYSTSTNRGHYADFDSSVRYLKYYLAKRLNYLCQKWQIPYKEFATDGNGELHEVSFVCDNTCIETRLVLDGETMANLPPLDETKYIGWYFPYNEEKYFSQMPIFTDCTLYAKKAEETP